MFPARIEDPDSTSGGDPDVSGFIGLEAVGSAGLIRLQVREDTAIAKGAVSGDIEYAHVPGTAVGYVQLLLVGCEGDAIGTFAVIACDPEIAFASHLVEQRLAGNASGKQIGEVDTAVDGVYDVVGIVQSLLRQSGDLAVLLRACDAACFAGEQTALMIEGEAVGAVAVLAEHGDRAPLPLHNTLGRDVAEEEISDPAEHRALGEGESAHDLLGNAIDEFLQVGGHC